MNHTTESLLRAYAACERGRYDEALEYLRDAASFAWIAGDEAQHAACCRASVNVARAIGKRHVGVVR